MATSRVLTSVGLKRAFAGAKADRGPQKNNLTDVVDRLIAAGEIGIGLK
jgi:hypothetical protein